jgi:hypothetical protein
MDFSRNRLKKCPNMHIQGITIHPVQTNHFLGVILDQELHWKAKVDNTIARGLAYVMQLCHLSMSAKGLPMQLMCQLYLLVLPNLPCQFKHPTAGLYQCSKTHSLHPALSSHHHNGSPKNNSHRHPQGPHKPPTHPSPTPECLFQSHYLPHCPPKLPSITHPSSQSSQSIYHVPLHIPPSPHSPIWPAPQNGGIPHLSSSLKALSDCCSCNHSLNVGSTMLLVRQNVGSCCT